MQSSKKGVIIISLKFVLHNTTKAMLSIAITGNVYTPTIQHSNKKDLTRICMSNGDN